MRRSLYFFIMASLLLPSILSISNQGSAPAPGQEGLKGPHLMLPNPDIYDSLPFPQNPPILGSARGTRGPLTNDILVLLVEFSDVTHDPAHNTAYISGMMNGNTKGDLRHYYEEVSFGQYQVQATVGGNQWFTSARPLSYYGTDSTTGVDDYNGPIYELVRETVQLADAAGVDFSLYDQDSDGVVDHLMVIHAGEGQESSLTTTQIWSHRWAVVNPNLRVDGVQVYTYTMVSEDSPIGVIAHEFGHDLGLPDLYDTDGSSKGAGIWDLMSTGSWAGNPKGTSPAHLSAWCKSALEWISPIEVTGPRYGVDIREAETNPIAFKLPIKDSTNGEYFLVENRQRVGYDTSMPGSGLLIWHIDESVANNDDDWHRKVDLEEADSVGGDSPEDAGDTWANNDIGFTPDTVPNSNGYGNVRTGWKVRNIGQSASIMTADISREVDDDLAIVHVTHAMNVNVNSSLTVAVEVANLGARNQSDLVVLISIFLGNHTPGDLINNYTRTLSLPAKSYTNFTLSHSPTVQGRHLVQVEAVMPNDEIPENNYKLSHFNSINAYFFDDVENGNKGWTLSPVNEIFQWQIVTQGGYTGDAMSPTHSWRFGSFTGINNISPLYTMESQTFSFQSGPLYLTFFHRYIFVVPSEVPVNNTDEGSVKVSFNGGPWLQVPGGRFNQTQLKWQMFHADLSSYATSPGTMRIRFESTAGYMPSDGGWWIDDVFVSPYRFGPAVGLVPVRTYLEVEPGDRAVFIFKVVNVGDFPDKLRFIVSSSSSWQVALSHNNSPPLVPETVEVALSPDRDAIMTLIVQTPGDAVRGSSAMFTLTARSETNTAKRDAFDATVTINDPLGLAKLGRYIVLFIVVLIVLVAIAMIIDHIKARRGIR